MQSLPSNTPEILYAIFYTSITIAIVLIFIVIGPYVGSPDNTIKIASALRTSYIIGAVMIAVLLSLHIMAISSNTSPEFVKTCMIYFTFIMAYTAMSISLINIKYS